MTLEKNVAIVVILTYRVVALSFSSARKVGKAMRVLPHLLSKKIQRKRANLFLQNSAILQLHCSLLFES